MLLYHHKVMCIYYVLTLAIRTTQFNDHQILNYEDIYNVLHFKQT